MKDKIDTQIEKLKSEIANLEAEKARLESLSPERRLAEALHSIQCNWNHTDGCGWYWEISDTNPGGTWAGYAHSEYLKKAQKILAALPDMSVNEIIKIAKLVK